MKNIVSYTINIILTTWLFFIIFSCTNNTVSNKKEEINKVNTITTTKASKKPPGTYQDTLTINLPAAVFYHPDSLQLEKIKAITDTMVYEGTMHDCFYQMRNSRFVLKKYYPRIKIIEVKNARFLLFEKTGGEKEYIDLNTKNDPCGMFIFDGQKAPRLVDMTNIESELGFYFSK